MNIPANRYYIRRATINDAHFIAKLHLETLCESYKSFIDKVYLENRSQACITEAHHQRIIENKVYYCVAILDKNLVGFCSAAPFIFHNNQKFTPARQMRRRGKGDIVHLYVHPFFSNRKLGRHSFNMQGYGCRKNSSALF